MARSMKTMPRASTCWPSGTWVDSTSMPARNAGKRIPNSICAIDLALSRREQSRDGVVIKAEESLRAVRSTHSKRQHHGGNVYFVRDEFRGPVVLVGRADHKL